jgi:hypothetical protein
MPASFWAASAGVRPSSRTKRSTLLMKRQGTTYTWWYIHNPGKRAQPTHDDTYITLGRGHNLHMMIHT